MTDIKPLADYILIEPLEGKDMIRPSGIILPDQAKERPQEGTVRAIGTKCDIKVGDTVYYKKWGGNEIKVDGVEFLLVKEEDVLAIIKEAK